ncbi:hypothetical protein CG478_007080 [Bacillus cytotoxicus]|nr:hypothetical protein CG483_008170 [Bacillus cytotoxicus]AWC32382.1 hypothetical protein CG482_008035 [Bacillus cytotoxicus]AWC36411.1 hypothetical protein CG481_008045 [Bacillus cytotoxicus]AWC40263.1 hypothetical protein CG480_007080 [Bacillus cytotoxicus]AWC44434.1 hypothetical protein CG479_007785 [Bacillus cytotoxicus]
MSSEKIIKICFIYSCMLIISGCTYQFQDEWSQRNRKKDMIKMSQILVNSVKKKTVMQNAR